MKKYLVTLNKIINSNNPKKKLPAEQVSKYGKNQTSGES